MLKLNNVSTINNDVSTIKGAWRLEENVHHRQCPIADSLIKVN